MCMDTAIIDQAVRIDKPPPPRVIIPALQIVQPRFRVVDVSAVAERVGCAEGGGQRAGGGQRVAPCVVGVGHDARAAGADETGHVALRVLDVEVLRLTLDVAVVVGIGRRALAVGDGRDVPARVVGVGIRRRAGFPRPDLPRGRRGRGIVVADRGLDHGLPAILRIHRGHPPQRVVGVARRDGSLRRFRQAVVLIVGIACSMATT